MAPAIADQLVQLTLFDQVTSTNDVLWQSIQPDHQGIAACLANSQTHGRGRRGGQWLSPASGNIYLSLLWPVEAQSLRHGLTIAVGISLIHSLKQLGFNDLKLKWPNDVLFERQKLAGILVESRVGKNTYVVIGLGLNYAMPTEMHHTIAQPIISLHDLNGPLPCRNRLAGTVIQNMIETLHLFSKRGLEDFLPEWPILDALHQQTVQIIDDQQTLTAQACGINTLGELLYRHNTHLHTLTSSHVSIRFTS